MSNITRTFIKTVCCVKLWDDVKDDVVEVVAEIEGKHDCESFKKEYSKIETRPILKVSDCVVHQDLLGMTETEFLKYGTVFDSRSKENRGMISKTVKSIRYYVKVWDSNTQSIVDTVVSAHNEKTVQKNLPCHYKFLKITRSEDVQALICMTAETFRKYGHPMTDHFHFAK